MRVELKVGNRRWQAGSITECPTYRNLRRWLRRSIRTKNHATQRIARTKMQEHLLGTNPFNPARVRPGIRAYNLHTLKEARL